MVVVVSHSVGWLRSLGGRGAIVANDCVYMTLGRCGELVMTEFIDGGEEGKEKEEEERWKDSNRGASGEKK